MVPSRRTGQALADAAHRRAVALKRPFEHPEEGVHPRIPLVTGPQLQGRDEHVRLVHEPRDPIELDPQLCIIVGAQTVREALGC